MEKIPNYLSVFYYLKINWTSDIQYYYFLKAVIQSPKKIMSKSSTQFKPKSGQKGVIQKYKMKMCEICYSI